MRKYFYLLLIGLVTFFQCNTNAIKDYAVVIKPMGPEDVPRTTFYISLKKTNFKKDNPFTDEILTDETSLLNIVSFIDNHRPIVNDTSHEPGWGALEISVYNIKHRFINFKLNKAEYSKNYLTLLIDSLVHDNSDAKLIKLLKEDGLSEIE